jgi:hypothetical protein
VSSEKMGQIAIKLGIDPAFVRQRLELPAIPQGSR